MLLIDGTNRTEKIARLPEHDLALTSYGLLRRDLELYAGLSLRTVVLDEAQHIKNPETQNAQAAFSLNASQRFVLTGTPMENSVRDLWSLMNFVAPGLSREPDRFPRTLRKTAHGGTCFRTSRINSCNIVSRAVSALSSSVAAKPTLHASCRRRSNKSFRASSA